MKLIPVNFCSVFICLCHWILFDEILTYNQGFGFDCCMFNNLNRYFVKRQFAAHETFALVAYLMIHFI